MLIPFANIVIRHSKVLLLVLTIIPWGMATSAAELNPFRAEYVAEFQGLPVKARGTRMLEKLDDGLYRLTSSADSFMVRVLEFSEFSMMEGQLIPRLYQYERKGIGRNKFEASNFDWSDMRVSHDETTSPLTPQTLDKLSYQYQLRLDVADAILHDDKEKLLSYIIADEEKRKEYVFRIVGNETLSTPLGDLTTVRIDRIHEEADKDRRASMWLSPDYDYVLVRLRIEDDDRGFELNIDSFEDLSVKPEGT